ncbi:hypothetical protein SELMODRAFT_420346 [Selaginella moellendorffii]|uniref:Uncharacterized protein n=1 Tax=Selaginella moellendorffii TaxID=88036 RepID=D8SBQ0_SELML|nr:hypothetical protein SELMODRAFT_420346 [Selaginella moellendorffii]
MEILSPRATKTFLVFPRLDKLKSCHECQLSCVSSSRLSRTASHFREIYPSQKYKCFVRMTKNSVLSPGKSNREALIFFLQVSSIIMDGPDQLDTHNNTTEIRHPALSSACVPDSKKVGVIRTNNIIAGKHASLCAAAQ